MISHSDLIVKLKECGYLFDREGMCFGIAAMGLQAILLKDLTTFKKRLEILSQIPKEKLVERINAAEKRRAILHANVRVAVQAEWREKEIKFYDEKIAFEKQLSLDQSHAYYHMLSARLTEVDKKHQEDDLMLSIPVFFEGIAIYFNPGNYPKLFEEYDLVLVSEKDFAEKKPGANQIILTGTEDGLLKYKIIHKGKIEDIIVSSKALIEELGDDHYKKFHAALSSYESAKLKPYMTNINNMISKIDPILKKDARPEDQDALLTFSRVLPAGLMEQKKDVNVGVQKVAAENGLYDQEELIIYFNVLAEKFVKNNVNEPVAFMLGSSNHAITVSWEPKTKSWRLIDADRFDLLDKSMTEKELAKNVLTGFSKNKITTFFSEVYASSASAKQVKTALDQCKKDARWQEIHKVSPRKASLLDSYDSSWLYIAAQKGQVEKVQQLLESKADVNQATHDGSTALYIAAQKGRNEMVKQLLEAKANINGATSLHIAAYGGHDEVIKQLLGEKADINQATYDGSTALYIAAENGHDETIERLLEAKADIHQAVHDGSTALYMAAENGHSKTVKLLLAAKAVVNAATKDHGSTALYIAAQNGHDEIVQQLLEAKASINQGTNNGVTPLYIAAQKRHVEVVKRLLEAGAAIDQATKNNGSTSLHMAVYEGHVEIVKQLLEAKAAINQTTHEGYTELYFAAQMGHSEIVQLLLEAKANANQATNNGSTALYAASQIGDIKTVNILLDQKSINLEPNTKVDTDVLIKASTQKNCQGALDKLFKRKGITKKTLANFSPLHAAAFWGNIDVVKALLVKGVNSNAKTENNISAFELAQVMGNKDICDLIKKEMIKKIHGLKVQKNLSFFNENKSEAKNDQEYLLLQKRLSQMKKTIYFKSAMRLRKKYEMHFLNETIKLYDAYGGKLPIEVCISEIIEDKENKSIYQRITKKGDMEDMFKVIAAKVSSKKAR